VVQGLDLRQPSPESFCSSSVTSANFIFWTNK